MTFLLFILYKHVVHVYLNIPPNLLDEHLVHKPLIHRPCILLLEWHDLLVKKPLARDERSLLLVSLVQLDMVVAGESVHETQ
mgnify:CR=1 FL=1